MSKAAKKIGGTGLAGTFGTGRIRAAATDTFPKPRDLKGGGGGKKENRPGKHRRAKGKCY